MHSGTLQKKSPMAGFSLIELMVAMLLGMLLTYMTATVYLSTKNSFRRQAQLSNLQQSARIAFDYLARDARMVGHQGCHTGRGNVSFFNKLASPKNIDTNFALGVEGYDYTNPATSPDAYEITDLGPANSTTATSWADHKDTANGIPTIPISTIGGNTGTAADGLTPGSDVLVMRSPADGQPLKLVTDTTASGNVLDIQASANGLCGDGSARMGGFCANSYGMVSSCREARVFSVASIAGTQLTLPASALGTEIYTTNEAEVFPLQTVVYYVKRSSNGLSPNATSLYRRVFNGETAEGDEQELIDGVENLQVRYGVDTTAPDPDGLIDGDYVTAGQVTDWSRVVAVRMSLLMRSTTPVEPDMAVPASGVVNGITVTYPAATPRHDRRIFTTTVAVRNKISYF